MDMKPVQSSQISEVGHDPASNTLAIRFKSGSLYHYADVSAEAHALMMRAESFGKHFGQHVRGKYDFTKIDETEKQES